MSLITLAQAKQHLKVLHDREDQQIQELINAALDNVSGLINRRLDGTDPVPFETVENAGVLVAKLPLELKPSLRSAALLILGDLYTNRDAQVTGTIMIINQTCERMMQSYRKMVV